MLFRIPNQLRSPESGAIVLETNLYPYFIRSIKRMRDAEEGQDEDHSQQSTPPEAAADAAADADAAAVAANGDVVDDEMAVAGKDKNYQDATELLEQAVESVVRITLAGFGGSMIGLSQERRLESLRVVSGAAAAAAARRKRAPVAAPLSNLPVTWAISCMSFCILLETCRNVSPTSWLLNQFLIVDDDVNTGGQPEQDPLQQQQQERGWPYPTLTGLSRKNTKSTVRTVGDFTIGGAIAGMVGSFGRNAHLRHRLPSAVFKGPQRFFGLVPGVTLGFAAGLLQASIDIGERYLLSTQARQSGLERYMDTGKEGSES
jgi:hypothetical protein